MSNNLISTVGPLSLVLGLGQLELLLLRGNPVVDSDPEYKTKIVALVDGRSISIDGQSFN